MNKISPVKTDNVGLPVKAAPVAEIKQGMFECPSCGARLKVVTDDTSETAQNRDIGAGDFLDNAISERLK